MNAGDLEELKRYYFTPFQFQSTGTYLGEFEDYRLLTTYSPRTIKSNRYEAKELEDWL